MSTSVAWSRTPRRVSYGPNDEARAFAEERSAEMGLTRSAATVYAVVASLTDADWSNCYQSINNLVKACGYSRPAVEKALAFLRNNNVIAVERSVQVNDMRPVRMYRLVKASFCSDASKG